MSHSAEFRRCLDTLDVESARRLWAHISPDAVQPKDDFEMFIMLHTARTQAASIPLKKRAYSHAWLIERELPSFLPDDLRPRAERMYPRVVEGVGVSVKAMSAASIPLARAIEQAMSDAVAECYADGKRDPIFIRARMEEARRRVVM